MPNKPYRLPDRPTNPQRPDPDALQARLDTLRARRDARIQAGRDGKN